MPSALTARLRRALPRMSRRRVVTGSVVVMLVAGLIGWAVWPASDAWTTSDQRITVLSGPSGTEPVELDSRFYLPVDRSGKVPAVLLAHGFGGSKQTVSDDAESLAEQGYAVLTWTARGFGASGGQIHLDSPDYEVRDAARLLDWLAARPEVQTDAANDPRVGVMGPSYGGALSLLLAGQDARVDAIVPIITWNDLSRSFLPNATGDGPETGVFKKGWAGLFFGSGNSSDDALSSLTGGGGDGEGDGDGGGRGAPAGPASDPACGRFAADVCAAYLKMATGGTADAATVALLQKSSPAAVLSKIKAPTLLIQGEVDTLFPLTEADANAKGIAATGTPVRVAWFTGGHDGGVGPQTDQDRTKYLTAQWFHHYLKGEGDAPSTSFTYSRVAGFSALDRGLVTNGYSDEQYPGLSGRDRTDVTVSGPAQPIANPPDGNPGALSSLPGLGGGLSSLLNGVSGDLPGQHAEFISEPVTAGVEVVGAPTVQVRAASPTGEAVLFVKLYDVDPNGAATLSAGLVAPVRLTGLGADIATAQPATVTLPAIVRRIDAGHRIKIVVATSDQAFSTPVQPTVYTVAVGAAGAAGATVTLPTVAGTPVANPQVLYRYVLLGLLAAIVIGLAVVLLLLRRRNRHADTTVVEEYAQTPLVVRGLRKAYGDGFVAVERVDFMVERGQVVGLLGPNGAGKTTTLRVLMGMTMPTAGEALIFGRRLVPGSPVLSRVGALVEGPGFLPHLSGYDNLKAYWRATGRPEADARFDEALEIAGLGDSVHRTTKNYSHGMRQRLAIAQAMLGLPELLVLDEPTDGLDPPQIAEMRRVLKRYATDGRAVLVSSHLLAEVEQTCTHAVVVNKGRIVASGLVDDIVGDSPSVQIEVSDVPAASLVLAGLGVHSVTPDGVSGLIVDMNGTPRSEVVASLVQAGVGVDRVVPRRRLEDAFLALVGDNSRGSGDR